MKGRRNIIYIVSLTLLISFELFAQSQQDIIFEQELDSLIEVFYQENKIDVQPEQILGTYSLSEGHGSQKIEFKTDGKYQLIASGCFGLPKKEKGKWKLEEGKITTFNNNKEDRLFYVIEKDEEIALAGPKSSEELKVLALDYYHQGKIEVAKEMIDEMDEKILQGAYRRIK